VIPVNCRPGASGLATQGEPRASMPAVPGVPPADRLRRSVRSRRNCRAKQGQRQRRKARAGAQAQHGVRSAGAEHSKDFFSILLVIIPRLVSWRAQPRRTPSHGRQIHTRRWLAFVRWKGDSRRSLAATCCFQAQGRRRNAQSWQPALSGHRNRRILRDVLARGGVGPRPGIAGAAYRRQRVCLRPRWGSTCHTRAP